MRRNISALMFLAFVLTAGCAGNQVIVPSADTWTPDEYFSKVYKSATQNCISVRYYTELDQFVLVYPTDIALRIFLEYPRKRVENLLKKAKDPSTEDIKKVSGEYLWWSECDRLRFF